MSQNSVTWLQFVKDFRDKHDGMSYVQALKEAAPHYNKMKGGQTSTKKTPQTKKNDLTWMQFVKEYRSTKPDLSYTQALKEASPLYNK